uniref:Uncharacterized protein MANES_16G007500 n=1 Tax=Rhizophora mucronata TaxID=61149 RepID=A0A2P2JVE6_RHIMU
MVRLLKVVPRVISAKFIATRLSPGSLLLAATAPHLVIKDEKVKQRIEQRLKLLTEINEKL